MKKPLILHPVLFAIYNILFLYSHNIEQTFFIQLIMPMAITTCITIIFWIITSIFFKDIIKGGLITTICLLLFFSYGHVYDAIENLAGGYSITGGKNKYFVPAWGLIFLISAFFIRKTRKNLNNITSIINLSAVFLIAVTLYNIGAYEFQKRPAVQNTSRKINEDVNKAKNPEEAKAYPNIYYIILDSHPSLKNLKEYYNYDNSEFIEFLKSKGFYVASESRSNYPITFLSIASSLNMEYINYLSDKIGIESADRNEPYQMIKNSKVVRLLKTKGYKYIHFGSGIGATTSNPNADEDIQCGNSNEFIWVLIQTTILRPFEMYLNLMGNDARKRTLCTFSKIPEIQSIIKNPFFIFAHILVPHAPYIFGANGEPVNERKLDREGSVWNAKQLYLDQLKFVDKKTIKLVNDILSREKETKPIIIIHADHGSSSTQDLQRKERPGERFLKERTGILNAYYLPNNGEEKLYNSITPVNTFRLIFNHYFHTKYSLLDDKIFFATYKHPYKFSNVTDIVK